ncbi:MAG TPA: Ig-like domain-containing protein [Verrucomicrobiae bacterium]
MTLRLLRDDGGLVYLNGAEIYRSNMPTGEVNYLTLALSSITGAAESTFYQANASRATLVSGTNVLAVEVHQGAANSADISFDLELIADLPIAAPAVSITSPTNSAAFPTPVSITLQATASDSDGSVTLVEFFADTNKLGGDPASPYAVTWDNVPAGAYALTAVATDDSGLRATSAPVNITVTSAGTALIAAGSTWKYLDTGINLGTAWRDLDFDDSAWASGPAQLGYGDGDEATVVSFGPDANNKYITTYFRRPFCVEDLSAYVGLTVDLLRDDGAVVYLNGRELFRSNMPAGAINDLTLASSGVSGSAESTFFRVEISPTNLVAGTNIVAVEIHQSAANSSDISFDLQLSGAALPRLTRGPYLQRRTTNSAVLRWRTDLATNSVVNYGPDPTHLTFTLADTAFTNEHVVQLTGLEAETKHFYSVGTSSNVLAGGDANHFFITAPMPGAVRPVRLWALGDSGTANDNARAVRDAYLNYTNTKPVDVWLMLGDNAYNSGLDSEYQAAVFDMYPTFLRNAFLWPTIGNHDSATSFPYLDIFTLPTAGEVGGVASGTQKYYSFAYANIHFICLDAMTSSRLTSGPMLTWLREDLSSTTQQWIIAFWHHPPYSMGNHNSDTEIELMQMRTNAVPILEEFGVDLVLCGHSHVFERSFFLNGHYGLSTMLTDAMKKDGGDGREDGTGAYVKSTSGTLNNAAVYVVAGSSGQTSSGPLNHPAMFISMKVLGSTVIDIESNRLDMVFLGSDSDGDVLSLVSAGPTSAQGGTVTTNGSWIFYTPPPGFTNADSFTYTISDGRGAPVTGSVMVRIKEDIVPSPNLTITDLGDGSFRIRGDGIPDRIYRIQFTEDVDAPNWQTLGSATANEVGQFELMDTPPVGSPQRFYRSIYP